MEQAYDEIRTLGAEVLALSVDAVPEARQMQQLVDARYPVLADPDQAVTKRYGVFDLLGDGVAAPTTIIVTAEHVVAMHVGQTIGDRPSTESILQVLRQLDAGDLESLQVT